MEVKIGIQHTPREIVLDSPLTPDEVESAVGTALASPGGFLRLVDKKGSQVIVPASTIAYVEIAESNPRRVGFST